MAKARRNLDPIWYLAGFLLLFRLSLLGSGTMAFQDEINRYPHSLNAASLALQGQVREAVAEFVTGAARPGDVLFRTIPAALQIGWRSLTGTPVEAPDSMVIPTLFNVAISLALVFAFYELSLVFYADRRLALAATVLYALLANTNLYIRHLLGYDLGLLLMLLALLLAARPASGKRAGGGGERGRALRCGLFCGASFLVYPGYYVLGFPVALLLLRRYWPARGRGGARDPARGSFTALATQLLFFTVAGLATLVLADLFTRIGGKSYFTDLRGFMAEDSASIYHQGTYDEGLVFVFRYLWEVEGLAGLSIIAGLSVYLFGVLRGLIQGPRRAIQEWGSLDWISALVTALLVQKAWSVYFAHGGVFYGRFLHAYYPFLVWMAVACLRGIRNRARREQLVKGTMAVSLFACLPFAFSMYGLAYPRDLMYRHRAEIAQAGEIRYHLESQPCLDYPNFHELARGQVSSDPRTLALILNPCFPYPATGQRTPLPALPPTTRTIYEGRHFVAYAPYQFEGYGVEARERLRSEPFRFGIFLYPVP